MPYWTACLIGLLQGITEFLPISSSAHLTLAKELLGLEKGGNLLLFDLVSHLGTMFAALWYFKHDIYTLFTAERKRLLLLCLSCLPLLPAYFFLRPLLKFFSQIEYLGFFLVGTSLILFLGERIRFQKRTDTATSLWVGAAQAAALLPGISRSASTISCARTLGWSSREAVRFSFLLAIPTIAGGNIVELLHMNSSSLFSISFSSCLIAFLSSLGMGLCTINYAIRWLEKGHFKPFAWYCLILGVVAIIWLNT